MTLAAARQHPWLQGYGPIQSRAFTQSPPIDSSVQGDQSMLGPSTGDDAGMSHDYNNEDPVSQEFEQMHLRQNGVPNGNPVRKEGSRILRRRSDIFSQAAEDENNGGVMEPSWQMISSSQAQDNAERNDAGPSTRGNKRKDYPMDMSLTPMPENEEWSATNDPPIDGCNGTGPQVKGKGREEDNTTPSRSVRGTRAKKPSSVPSDQEPPLKVRRSSRQTPQKNTRR